ncbi:MAG: hypothetical protein JWM02_635 [Frankiales bacterium]|nr:hypothetical protein [Frankiales bacterium]
MLRTTAVVIWGCALFSFGTGISPGLGEPTETQTSVRAGFLVLGVLLVALPLLLIALPATRRVRRLLDAVLAVAAEHPTPEVPPFETWAGPERMFRRLQLSCYTYVAIPLLLLLGSAIAFGFFLGEPVAAVVSAILALIPLFFAVVTSTVPGRLRQGVRAGLEAGQLLALRVDSRVDQKLLLTDAYMSWFDGILPDGQHVTLRTPTHFAWVGDARHVVDDPDLVLVMGTGGHQGLLLAPRRPEDAVWLLGPVPLVRVPRAVLRAFSTDAK